MRTTSSLLLLFLFILTSCTSVSRNKFIAGQTSDLFGKESLWRKSSFEKSEVWMKSCVEGEMAQFTENARERFQTSKNDFLYWNNLGNCLAWNDELKEAKFFLSVAQQLAKTPQEKSLIQNNMAIVYFRQGRFTHAFNLLQEAQKTSPEFVTPKYNLAQVYLSQKNTLEGLKILNTGIFKDSEDQEILHLKGVAYLQLGKMNEADSFLKKIPDRSFKREDFALTMAQLRILQDRPHEAMKLIADRNASGLPDQNTKADALWSIAKERVKIKEAP